MSTALRRAGIAIGSLVAATLVVWAFEGLLGGALAGLIAIILGGLIYSDIMRREPRAR